MRCDRCILAGGSPTDLPLEQFLEELAACDECPEAAAGPPALLTSLDRLRQSGRALRKAQSKLRQSELELEEAVKGAAQYEARIENRDRVYKQSARELEPQLAVAQRQAETIRALSAPVLEVGEGVVAMPIIGSLDEKRAKLMTSTLLAWVEERETRYAILDLTGLEDVDTETAMHLVQVCKALRLLGARVVVCGLRGRVAQELAGLGADLSAIQTLPSLRSALQKCR